MFVVIFCYNSVEYVENFTILSLLLLEMIYIKICWSNSHHILTVLSPYLVIFDVISTLLIFWGKVTAQLTSGGKDFDGFVCKSFLISAVKK